MIAIEAPSRRFARTLRARFLMVALIGVLLPLVIVGVWLTNSAERSGRELLRGQLARAGDVLATTMGQRWDRRIGELRLLAGNTVAGRLVSGERISAADSLYLEQLTRNLSSAFTEIVYVNGAGEDVWAAPRGEVAHDARRAADEGGSIRMEELIAADGRRGRAQARVRLSSIMPPDVNALVPAGAIVTVRAGGGLIWSSASGVQDAARLQESNEWQVHIADIESAGLTLALAAPVTPFVRPFEQATRTSLTILAAVALVVVLITIWLTTRVTRTLQELSAAASGIAAGHLDLRVEPPDDDDVGPLAHAFNGMTASLRGTLAELSEQRALAAVGEFAASLSHEVRNRLTAIRVDLQHARRQLADEHSSAPLLGRALESVHRLDASVTAALRVARGAAQVPGTVSIRVSLENAMATVNAVFAERGVILVPLAESQDALVVGDAAALEHVFVNVLLNAAEAMEPGGAARIDMIRGNTTVSVRIADTGSGFPGDPSVAGSRLFYTTKQRGTGLGLPIARRITETYGGRLTVENSSGGAVVTVELPLESSADQRHFGRASPVA